MLCVGGQVMVKVQKMRIVLILQRQKVYISTIIQLGYTIATKYLHLLGYLPPKFLTKVKHLW